LNCKKHNNREVSTCYSTISIILSSLIFSSAAGYSLLYSELAYYDDLINHI
jgi:hypothetical protein